MTAAEFIEKFNLDVPVGTYSAWERGYSYPNLRQAFSVAEKLGRTVTDIWYFED